MKYNVGDIVSFNSSDGQIPDFASGVTGCRPGKVSINFHKDNRVVIRAKNISYPWDYLCEYQDIKGNFGILAFKESGLKDYIGSYPGLPNKTGFSFNGYRIDRFYKLIWSMYIPAEFNNVQKDTYFDPDNKTVQVTDDDEYYEYPYQITFTNIKGNREVLWVNEGFFKDCSEVNSNSVNNKSKTKTNGRIDLQGDDLQGRETIEKRGLGSTSSRGKILIRSYPSPRAEELGKHRKTGY